MTIPMPYHWKRLSPKRRQRLDKCIETYFRRLYRQEDPSGGASRNMSGTDCRHGFPATKNVFTAATVSEHHPVFIHSHSTHTAEALNT